MSKLLDYIKTHAFYVLGLSSIHPRYRHVEEEGQDDKHHLLLNSSTSVVPQTVSELPFYQNPLPWMVSTLILGIMTFLLLIFVLIHIIRVPTMGTYERAFASDIRMQQLISLMCHTPLPN
jgi:hypothetical protein